jgi:hypothetical protein
MLQKSNLFFYFYWVLKSLFLEKPFSFYQFLFLNSVKNSPSHLSLCQPWPTYWARPTYRRQPTSRARPAARSVRLVASSPRSLVSPSPLRLPGRLRRLATAMLNSDELRWSLLLRWCSVDRSSDIGSTCPRDLLNCPLDACIPFVSEARDFGHGDLELALKLLCLVRGKIWAW